MADNINNKKIVNLFGKKSKTSQGFEFVKLTKDSNGLPFKEDNLITYAQECHYIVRVMKKHNNEVCLYNYNIPNKDLIKFLENIDGTLIEIEKFLPKDLV